MNNDHQELNLHLSVEGSLRSYITLKDEKIKLSKEDDYWPVEYTIDLPPDLPPGDSHSYILVEQDLNSENNLISSKLVLKYKIISQGPFPDKYISAKLNFHESGDSIRFVSEVENLGKKDLGAVKTTFYVNDKEQQPQILETKTESLKTKETKLLDTSISRDIFERGEFEVVATTTYDDQQIELVQKMMIGRPSVEISYFDSLFTARKINIYTMDLLNRWNTELKNVFVDVEVKKDDQKIDNFRTKLVDLDAESARRINDYFDARDKDSGKYTFDMAVNFWNTYRMEEQRFTAELLPEGQGLIEAPPLIAGSATAISTEIKNPPDSSWFWIAAATVSVLLLCWVSWRYLHRADYES